MNTVSFKKVISASRRLEMVAFFPRQIVHFLTKRCHPEKVHTLVLWSKNPRNLIENKPFRNAVKLYEQLFLHFTITGMGSSFLEPNVPEMKAAIEMLPLLVDFLGSPNRIRVRFDPIVHLRLSDGTRYTNLPHFIEVAAAAKQAGIDTLVVSWMENYPKVRNRLLRHQIVVETMTGDQWKDEWEWLFSQAQRIGVTVSGCCVPGLDFFKCIDGALLSKLHPNGELASIQKAKGQRTLCGCTESWDIGWYYPCPGGCLYCYANPAEETK